MPILLERMMRFVRVYIIRIVVGGLLTAMMYGAIFVYVIHQTHVREQRIVGKMPNASADWRYCGPDWTPQLARRKVLPLYRVAKLEFHSPAVSNDALLEIKSLTNLEQLILRHTKTSDTDLELLKDLRHLGHLNLRNTRITDAGLQHLSNLVELQSLNLSMTHVNGTGLTHLAQMTRLETLDLRNTQLKDAGLAHLSQLTSLRWLDVSRTEVTNAGLVHLAGLTHLEELDVSGTNVTPESQAALEQWLPNCIIDFGR